MVRRLRSLTIEREVMGHLTHMHVVIAMYHDKLSGSVCWGLLC